LKAKLGAGSKQKAGYGKTGMADQAPPWRATPRPMAGVLGGPQAESIAEQLNLSRPTALALRDAFAKGGLGAILFT
jgi:hypothetical protein